MKPEILGSIPNGVANLSNRIFHMRSHSIGETYFLFKALKSPLFLFIFQRENKIRNKTLKNDSCFILFFLKKLSTKTRVWV